MEWQWNEAFGKVDVKVKNSYSDGERNEHPPFLIPHGRSAFLAPIWYPLMKGVVWNGWLMDEEGGLRTLQECTAATVGISATAWSLRLTALSAQSFSYAKSYQTSNFPDLYLVSWSDQAFFPRSDIKFRPIFSTYSPTKLYLFLRYPKVSATWSFTSNRGENTVVKR